ncbi:uncharacterized protein ARMOST_18809 [Armillaria ostoyae]|uniref:Uncharacterized protein n=1 Tax=Armillaria ostoyae TaxID=47428 RepID=A0A284S2U7_ARMOS|nr:uncharacterized protein ARMOST_18809 [Armillaria ostoyae]
MGTMDTTQMKGLPDLKKEDTARKSVDAHRQPGASKIVDGAAYTWFRHASIQNKKGNKKTSEKVTTESPPTETNAEINKNDEEIKSSWIYELHERGNINTADLQAWIHEGNHVQWFRAEAEMLRWQEHHEIKQAEFLRVLRSFTAQKNTWLKAAEMIHSDTSSKPSYLTYAREQAAMLDDMIGRTRQYFMKAGYAHVLNRPDGELLTDHLMEVRNGTRAMYVPMTVRSDEKVKDTDEQESSHMG